MHLPPPVRAAARGPRLHPITCGDQRPSATIWPVNPCTITTVYRYRYSQENRTARRLDQAGPVHAAYPPPQHLSWSPSLIPSCNPDPTIHTYWNPWGPAPHQKPGQNSAANFPPRSAEFGPLLSPDTADIYLYKSSDKRGIGESMWRPGLSSSARSTSRYLSISWHSTCFVPYQHTWDPRSISNQRAAA